MNDKLIIDTIYDKLTQENFESEDKIYLIWLIDWYRKSTENPAFTLREVQEGIKYTEGAQPFTYFSMKKK